MTENTGVSWHFGRSRGFVGQKHGLATCGKGWQSGGNGARRAPVDHPGCLPLPPRESPAEGSLARFGSRDWPFGRFCSVYGRKLPRACDNRPNLPAGRLRVCEDGRFRRDRTVGRLGLRNGGVVLELRDLDCFGVSPRSYEGQDLQR